MGEVGEVRAAVELVHGRRRRLGALRGVSAVELALEEDDVDVVLPCPGAHSAARGFAKLAPPKLLWQRFGHSQPCRVARSRPRFKKRRTKRRATWAQSAGVEFFS